MAGPIQTFRQRCTRVWIGALDRGEHPADVFLRIARRGTWSAWEASTLMRHAALARRHAHPLVAIGRLPPPARELVQ